MNSSSFPISLSTSTPVTILSPSHELVYFTYSDSVMIPVDDGGTSQLSPLHSTVHLGPDRDTKESLVQTREKVF